MDQRNMNTSTPGTSNPFNYDQGQQLARGPQNQAKASVSSAIGGNALTAPPAAAAIQQTPQVPSGRLIHPNVANIINASSQGQPRQVVVLRARRDQVQQFLNSRASVQQQNFGVTAVRVVRLCPAPTQPPNVLPSGSGIRMTDHNHQFQNQLVVPPPAIRTAGTGTPPRLTARTATPILPQSLRQTPPVPRAQAVTPSFQQHVFRRMVIPLQQYQQQQIRVSTPMSPPQLPRPRSTASPLIASLFSSFSQPPPRPRTFTPQIRLRAPAPVNVNTSAAPVARVPTPTPARGFFQQRQRLPLPSSPTALVPYSARVPPPPQPQQPMPTPTLASRLPAPPSSNPMIFTQASTAASAHIRMGQNHVVRPLATVTASASNSNSMTGGSYNYNCNYSTDAAVSSSSSSFTSWTPTDAGGTATGGGGFQRLALPAPPSSANASPSTMPTNSNNDQRREAFISIHRRYLALLFHASVCLRRVEAAYNAGQPRPHCSVPSCQDAGQILRHARSCKAPGATCPVPRCFRTRSLVDHWNSCLAQNPPPDCPICWPIRVRLEQTRRARRRAADFDQIRARHRRELVPVRVANANLNWRAMLPPESRKNFIRNIVMALIEAIQARDLQHVPGASVPHIVSSVKRAENGAYEAARSREEYLLLLAARAKKMKAHIQQFRQGPHTPLQQAALLLPPPSAPAGPPPFPLWLSPKLLMGAFTPVVDALFAHPESIAFRQPVDALALNLSDYFTIVKRPMDLRTIREKLTSGAYMVDAWLFVDDVWLMLGNCWLYNTKNCIVRNNCDTLASLFKELILGPMKELGYCCAERRTFQLLVEPEAEVPPKPKRGKPKVKVVRPAFDEELEPFVKCTICGRRQHMMCELYSRKAWEAQGRGYQCNTCLANFPATAAELRPGRHTFRAWHLKVTQLGSHIEARVNTFLRSNIEAGEAAASSSGKAEAASSQGYVWIRVVSTTDKKVQLLPRTLARFADPSTSGPFHGRLQPSYPYRSKVLLAFQQQDGVDVCFFCMYVQEYGSDCPPPNTRRAYIAYLDSVQHLRPDMGKVRTGVYHEILLGYLQHMKEAGFETAHIWACPPKKGDEYIFYRHPRKQIPPTQERLSDWYKAMLAKGVGQGIVLNFQSNKDDIFDTATAYPERMPYFEGDLWPRILESAVEEFETAEEKVEQPPAKKARMSKTKTKGRSSTTKKPTPASATSPPPSFEAKIHNSIKNQAKEVLFVVRLNITTDANDSRAQPHAVSKPIVDEEPVPAIPFIDSRDAFLAMQQERRWEFSCLRRTKWSTHCIVSELLAAQTAEPGVDVGGVESDSLRDAFHCNICQQGLPAESEKEPGANGNGVRRRRLHCAICEDFDLCPGCYARHGHQHRMEEVKLARPTTPQPQEQQPANDGEVDMNSAKLEENWAKNHESYRHVSVCTNAACPIEECVVFKALLEHRKHCAFARIDPDCCEECTKFCRLVWLHASKCQRGPECEGMFCASMKELLAAADADDPHDATPPPIRQFLAALGNPRISLEEKRIVSLAAIPEDPDAAFGVLRAQGYEEVRQALGIEGQVPASAQQQK